MGYSPAAVLAKVIDDMTPDLRLKNAVMLDALSRAGRIKKDAAATALYWNAIATGSTAATAAMSTAGTSQATGDAVQASLSIGGFKLYHQFDVGLVELTQARKEGVGALKELFGQNVSGGLLSIRRQLNTLLWTGTGNLASAGVVGMSTVLNATAAYAGIDPATYTQWVPITLTNGTSRPLTRDLLYDWSTAIEVAETYNDVIFCAPTLSQNYNKLWDTVAGTDSITRGQVDLGYSTRSYNGTPIISDPQCPTGQFVGVRVSDIELISLDLGNADNGALAGLGLKSNVSSVESADVGGLAVNVALLPQTNPGVLTFQMFVCPQLKVINRRGVQAILNLS